jgi:hypothetical protein
VYLSWNSALRRLRSIPVVHLDVKLLFFRSKKRDTQRVPIFSCATAFAKFRTTSLVGGSPRFDKPSIYCTSSNSCYGLSFCRSCDAPAYVRITLWCLRDSVVRLALNCAATFPDEKGAPSSRDSITAIASSIRAILKKLSRVEYGEGSLF